MFEMLLFFWWVVGVIAIGAIASQRGHDGAGIFALVALSVVLSPLFMWFVVVALPRHNEMRAAQQRHEQLLAALQAAGAQFTMSPSGQVLPLARA
jgi:hypothetical protein